MYQLMHWWKIDTLSLSRNLSLVYQFKWQKPNFLMSNEIVEFDSKPARSFLIYRILCIVGQCGENLFHLNTFKRIDINRMGIYHGHWFCIWVCIWIWCRHLHVYFKCLLSTEYTGYAFSNWKAHSFLETSGLSIHLLESLTILSFQSKGFFHFFI